MIDQRTSNLALALPHADNSLQDDVVRLRSALNDLDALLGGNTFVRSLNAILLGTPTAPTPAAGTNSAQIATTAFVVNAIAVAIAGVINSAPGALDTLDELAAALGDDPNFAATVINGLAGKFDKIGGNLTGLITLAASVAGFASMVIPQGIDPTAPPDGAFWHSAAGFRLRHAGATDTVVTRDRPETLKDKTMDEATFTGDSQFNGRLLSDAATTATGGVIDCAVDNSFYLNVAGAVSLTMVNAPASGVLYDWELELLYTSGSVGYPASWKVNKSILPNLTAGKTYIYTGRTRDGGATHQVGWTEHS